MQKLPTVILENVSVWEITNRLTAYRTLYAITIKRELQLSIKGVFEDSDGDIIDLTNEYVVLHNWAGSTLDIGLGDTFKIVRSVLNPDSKYPQRRNIAFLKIEALYEGSEISGGTTSTPGLE